MNEFMEKDFSYAIHLLKCNWVYLSCFKGELDTILLGH